MKTITVSTKHLYSAWVNTFFEDQEAIGNAEFGAKSRAIASGNMKEIREMFKEGYTMMLMGSRMGEIDFQGSTEIDMEIRVYHGFPGKLIGVIIKSEIVY